MFHLRSSRYLWLLLLTTILCVGIAYVIYRNNTGTIPGIAVPLEPNVQENNKTIAGIDSNNNGVRDDIDAYIESNFSIVAQRKAALQIAAVLQAAITVDKSDATAVKAVSLRMNRAVRCIYNISESINGSQQFPRVISEIESLSTNTKPRILAYHEYNKAVSGTASSEPQGDSCE